MTLPHRDRSRAILIGSSTYSSRKLINIPAVTNNITALAAIFTDPLHGHLAHKNCEVVRNPANPVDLYRQIRETASSALDTLIIYFSGHGLVSSKGELFLALKETDPSDLRHTAFTFEAVREILAECPAERRVVILDCCYSGRAIDSFMSDRDGAVAGQVHIEGTYTLTSSDGNRLSVAPKGAEFTAFSGELISTLRQGIQGGPELIRLSSDLYPVVRASLSAKGLPSPLQVGFQTIGSLALTKNPAFDSRATSHHSSPGPRSRRDEPSRTRQASSGSWLDGIDTSAELTFVNPPERTTTGEAGCAAFASTTIALFLSLFIAWIDGFGKPSTALSLSAIAACVTVATAWFSRKRKIAGSVLALGTTAGYIWLSISSGMSDHWALMTLSAIEVVAFSIAAIFCIAMGAETEDDMQRRAVERELDPDSIMQMRIEATPLTNAIRNSRWFGRPSDLPIFDHLAHLPSARFIEIPARFSLAASRSGVSPSSGFDFGEQIDAPDRQIGPSYAVICGTKIVMVYLLPWGPGSYHRMNNASSDLRCDGALFEAGKQDIERVSRNLDVWRGRLNDGAVVAGLMLVVSPPEKSKTKRRSNTGAYTTVVRDASSSETRLSTPEAGGDEVGHFLATDAHLIDLRIMGNLLSYGSSRARSVLDASTLGAD
ncbi:caspase family protein [Dactylosporangium aurantiacum]|uniref:Caspase family protein n=1 Tax=Dactylosporangium aurantiacum TaxID=35754 RepID=A0A9Q9MJB1_9ACTN|nr:caspase family protein [Dactylosporangium aurantiacum]MDG6107345.1 caspase family protein [Dactylosporangium aurantiacum]UWZ54521.1 caspase family protein [Dactylosporangium aurantiacum]